MSDSLVYMKQYVGNACGTIGLLHAMSNAGVDASAMAEGSYMSKFCASTKGMDADEIGRFIEEDDAIEEAHVASASEGVSDASVMDVNSHFICFSHVDGSLYGKTGKGESPNYSLT